MARSETGAVPPDNAGSKGGSIKIHERRIPSLLDTGHGRVHE
ncbi:hypothetical protein PT277_07605 [Acetobacteraceae bacterium ESL0709]|nr:hypothetical protein [Acetobacteraceae bacterium ESL0709]